ncbi:amino acid ABC transporter permease [Arcanobacterium haemolyticum]|uniref:Polar amino acid ABC transporter, inner membrane subunit n=1 Tax=Arcanobacterium haemolyticum (strain ATCC 9345 / DSM 20595 / CCM 5947 / CCUG 17215 / LMG 16163 / NBRC 15585 / NCTC 8452 / 11018) TaxID=644284 RepID=D7BPL7_ARCHD|nr:amino acid ABC transporter permease [Arcanobacterium haemolyticum]ADH92866.1 polar amino acid ABC transporter, inner membrane subunit [Arcanobacterium haemolyticum DSM 20595]QCX46952.1 amino acid ABC transporter permease [Arcanobacterium haemolyticum]SQH28385.1 L-cystine transport system permease protein tcyB [Arcanobacterium haemolyticum]
MTDALSLWADSLPALLAATVTVTIPLALISFVIALVLGGLVAVVRFERILVLAQIGAVYVWIFRGTPLLVQLFIVFYGLPRAGIVIDAWPVAIMTLALNAGAYTAEALRSGLKAVPRGQWEAGQSLNMTHRQILWSIVAPQAFRIAIPPLSSDFIDLVKGTSLVSSITLVDVFLRGQQLAAVTFEPLLLYVEVAFIYLMINSVLTAGQHWLEKRTSKFVEAN